eukprot:332209_1
MEEYSHFMNMSETEHKSCNGLGRYAAEHWVHSHPSVNPCDLSTSEYVWRYDGLPKKKDLEKMTLLLKPAPRYAWDAYVKINVNCMESGHDIQRRLGEYGFLYSDAVVPSTWWGWEFWNVSSPVNV